VIDRKFEPLVNRLMRKYLGELEDDDLVLFVLEHLKDHKAPQKLVDGLEPVRPSPSPHFPSHADGSAQVLEEDAEELAVTVWRQVIFESTAYGEGLHTERMMLD
jgi:RNA-binding protein 25